MQNDVDMKGAQSLYFGIRGARILRATSRIGHRVPCVRMLGVSMASLLLCSLPGCLLGPDFESPHAEIPGQWSGPMASNVSEEMVDIAEWWKQFKDPVLDSLVILALESNHDLEGAEARVREARAFRGLAAEDLRPSGGVSGSYTIEGTPKVTGNGAASPVSLGLSNGLTGPAGTITVRGENFTLGQTISGAGGATSIALTPGTMGAPDRTQDLFSTGFDARWELDVFGGVRRGIEAASADMAAAEANLHDVQVILTSEVARNYFELRGAQSRLDIIHQNIAAQKNTLSITTLRFEGGLTSGLDARQAQAQLSLTQSQVPQLEFLVLSSIYRLAVLAGQMPQSVVDMLSLSGPLPAAPPVVPVGMPSDLLRRRPDIRRSEQQLHAATARIGVAVADLFPKFAMAGRTGASFSGLESINAGDATFWSLGPAVQFPIFDRGRIRANVAVQNARQEAALAAYEQSVLVALEDAERALASYAKEQARRSSLEEALKASQDAAGLATDLYTEGLADFLNVLQAQGSVLATQDQLVQSNQLVLQNLVALYKAIGGGWDASESNMAGSAAVPANSVTEPR